MIRKWRRSSWKARQQSHNRCLLIHRRRKTADLARCSLFNLLRLSHPSRHIRQCSLLFPLIDISTHRSQTECSTNHCSAMKFSRRELWLLTLICNLDDVDIASYVVVVDDDWNEWQIENSMKYCWWWQQNDDTIITIHARNRDDETNSLGMQG